jgi:hypothetical protein
LAIPSHTELYSFFETLSERTILLGENQGKALALVLVDD